MNDLTKEHKEITLQWIGDRLHSGGIHSHWMVRHGLRSLLKSEDQEALKFLKMID